MPVATFGSSASYAVLNLGAPLFPENADRQLCAWHWQLESRQVHMAATALSMLGPEECDETS